MGPIKALYKAEKSARGGNKRGGAIFSVKHQTKIEDQHERRK
jgi:hypothetical protein